MLFDIQKQEMNYLTDRLFRLAMLNNTSQIYFETSKIFLEELVIILNQTDNENISSILIRILPLLSSNLHTKSILIQLNIISILQRIFEKNSYSKIQRYILLSLRNFSDQIIHMENLNSLILILIKHLSSTTDCSIRHYIIDILSNLSCENQSNKILMIENNLISLLIDILINLDNSTDIIESIICILRHLTGKCSLANKAREYIRISNAIPYFIKYLYTEENNWLLIKTCIGLLRNLALSSENLSILCEYRCVYRIGQLFLQMKMITERNELFITTLLIFSQRKDEFERVIYDQMINSGCVEIIAQLASQNINNRLKQMSKIILNHFHQSTTIEHRQIIKQIEKSIKIALFV